MQMTTEARAWLDATVRRILARHTLGDPERAGITYELMSHLHGAGEAHAAAAGRTEVAREDIEAALAKAGGDDGLAAAFVQPLSKPVVRVLFWRRLAAFVIDVVLIALPLGFVHGALTFLLMPFFQDATGHAGEHAGFQWVLPWGFHDASMPLAVQGAIAAASFTLVLAYFTWFEGHEGRSLGKRALSLRVMRVDGRPLTYREAFLRNLVKLAPPLLILDTLVMLVAFNRDKQRVSDRVAGTIVVRI